MDDCSSDCIPTNCRQRTLERPRTCANRLFSRLPHTVFEPTAILFRRREQSATRSSGLIILGRARRPCTRGACHYYSGRSFLLHAECRRRKKEPKGLRRAGNLFVVHCKMFFAYARHRDMYCYFHQYTKKKKNLRASNSIKYAYISCNHFFHRYFRLNIIFLYIFIIFLCNV